MGPKTIRKNTARARPKPPPTKHRLRARSVPSSSQRKKSVHPMLTRSKSRQLHHLGRSQELGGRSASGPGGWYSALHERIKKQKVEPHKLFEGLDLTSQDQKTKPSADNLQTLIGEVLGYQQKKTGWTSWFGGSSLGKSVREKIKADLDRKTEPNNRLHCYFSFTCGNEENKVMKEGIDLKDFLQNQESQIALEVEYTECPYQLRFYPSKDSGSGPGQDSQNIPGYIKGFLLLNLHLALKKKKEQKEKEEQSDDKDKWPPIPSPDDKGARHKTTSQQRKKQKNTKRRQKRMKKKEIGNPEQASGTESEESVSSKKGVGSSTETSEEDSAGSLTELSEENSVGSNEEIGSSTDSSEESSGSSEEEISRSAETDEEGESGTEQEQQNGSSSEEESKAEEKVGN